ARVSIAGETRTIRENEASLEIRVDNDQRKIKERLLEAIRRFGEPGGGRGSFSAIYSPADDGVVNPSGLKIRWVPQGTPRPLVGSIATSDGKLVWSNRDANAAAGKLSADSDAAVKKALKNYRDDRKLRSVPLPFKEPSQPPQSINFWI